MSSSSSDHQQQLSILQDEIATLKAQKEGLARIATQTLSLLRAQPLAVRPEGIWIQEGDQAQMEEIEGGVIQLDTGKAWRWTEITEETTLASHFPLYHTSCTRALPRPDITPFRGSFPLEILEAIVELCGTTTQLLFSQSSLACLNLFGPKILKEAMVRRDNGTALRSLFSPHFNQAYRITREAALAMSNWSRLQSIYLVGMDLVVFRSHDDDETVFLEDVIDGAIDHRPSFFLGLGGSKEALEELSPSASKAWHVRWDLKDCEDITPFGPTWHTLPEQLVKRDETLRSGRVTSAIIIVKDSEIGETMEVELKKLKKANRGPLKVVYKKAA